MNALKLVREVDRQINNGELSYEEGVELLHPLFDVEPVRHGHWVKPKGSLWDIGTCSVCGEFSVEGENALYCPHCGAKMDGE